MGVKFSPLSNLKYSHLKLGTLQNMLSELVLDQFIFQLLYSRNMILVYNLTVLRSTNALDTFSTLYI